MVYFHGWYVVKFKQFLGTFRVLIPPFMLHKPLIGQYGQN